MPTFLVLKAGSVVETVRGANPSALTAAVRKAARDAASAWKTGAMVLQGPHHVAWKSTMV